MESDSLRQLAAALRKEAAELETTKMVKCGQLLQAAQALTLLREKVHYVR